MNDEALTVASKGIRLSPDEFTSWVDDRYAAIGHVLDTVKEQVSEGAFEPIVGMRIIACATGSVFGYEEFHPRGDTPPAEQFLEAVNRGLNRGLTTASR